MVEKTIPAILLCNTHQYPAIVGVCWTNDKVATKSLEQGVLWQVHPHTHKAVEYAPTLKVVAVHKKKNWCEIELDSHSDHAIISQLPSIFTRSSDASHSTHVPIKNNNRISEKYEFLGTLQKIIEERKSHLSDGSYTAHLFKSGKEKIRKKLGEEAIETILATDENTLVSESADLLYHLFVMLIHEDIDPNKIMDELYTRFLK